MKKTISKTNCPLCAQANHCGMEKGLDNCWCAAEGMEFPGELLQQLPDQQGDNSCICEACVQAFHAKARSQ
ncbi:MAG: cysteine-rich CWC family protein [Candidatus Reddybacter sp.]